MIKMNVYINDDGKLLQATEKAFKLIYEAQGYRPYIKEKVKSIKEAKPGKANKNNKPGKSSKDKKVEDDKKPLDNTQEEKNTNPTNRVSVKELEDMTNEALKDVLVGYEITPGAKWTKTQLIEAIKECYNQEDNDLMLR